MTNEERLKNLLIQLKDLKVNVSAFIGVNKDEVIISGGGYQVRFNNMSDAIKHLEELRASIDDEEEAKAKQRRQLRALLLEASEEIAKKYNKQVFTLSMGKNDDYK